MSPAPQTPVDQGQMAGVALPLVCDCERTDGRPPIPGMDKSQKLRLRVLLVDERGCGASTDQVLAGSSLSSQAGTSAPTSTSSRTRESSSA
jgi:hypothetical protein